MSTAFAVDPVRRPFPARPVAPAPAPVPVPVPPPADAVAVGTAVAARPRVVAASAVLAGVVCVVAAQLLLSIGTANGAYRLAELQHRSDLLARQQQVQEESLQQLAAPGRLAAAATALGMVPDDSTAYLDVRTGRVLGGATAERAALAR